MPQPLAQRDRGLRRRHGHPRRLRLSAGTLYRTRTFAVLGHRLAVQLADADLGRYLDHALGPFAVGGGAATVWSILDQGDEGGHRFLVRRNGDRLFEADRREDLAPVLLWWVNRMACFETDDRLMVHASVAATGGRAVLMPAPQQSGKTTLVAGLVGAGFDYVTDEAAALDPATGRVDPYPKALSIDPDAWELFAGYRPALAPELERFAAEQWHVPADTIRPGSVLRAPAEPAWIVTPRYRAGAATRLEPLSRPQALEVLAGEAFNLARFGQAGLDLLAGVVRRCECYRLEMGDLPGAVAAVRDVCALRGLPDP